MEKGGLDLYSNVIYLGSMGAGLLFCLAYQSGCFRLGREISRGAGCALAALPFALILGLRAYTVGYDTYSYTYHIYGSLITNADREVVFSFVVRLLHWLTGGKNYTAMLLFFSFATVFLAFYASDLLGGRRRMTVFYSVYCLMFGLCVTDQFRQLLGCSLFLLALAFYYKDKKAVSLFVAFLAAGVHLTSLLALAVYIVCCLVVREKERQVAFWFQAKRMCALVCSKRLVLFFVLLTTGTLLFYISGEFLELIAQLLPKAYARYITERLDYKQIGFGLLLDSMIAVPGIFLSRYTQNKKEKAMLLFGLLIPAFRICGYVSYFLYRMIYYPQIVLMAFYAVVLAKRPVPVYWKWIILGICGLFYAMNYMYMDYHGSFPYRFYFEVPGLW